MSVYKHEEHIATDWFAESGIDELNLCEDCPALKYYPGMRDAYGQKIEPDDYECVCYGDATDDRCYYSSDIQEILKTLKILDDAMLEAKRRAEK